MKDPSNHEQSSWGRHAGPLVVGLGASAGGLKALQDFVRAVPADSGMAYVVVLHLDPDRESRMAALLQDRSSIPVTQVTEPTRAEPNHIYIAPPDRDMEMQGGTIGLVQRRDRAERAPIDLFLRTLAEAAGAEATGVILSGTGRDGTVGIRAIREAGGITVAQSPDEAEYDGMPSSAIATGLVDFVMPAAGIPAELIRLRDSVPLLGPTEDESDLEDELEQIFALLRSRTGHDFGMYKTASVLRRLKRRLLFNDLATLGEYISLLRTDATECRSLMQDLLISVSSFFRDPEEFAALATIVPQFFDGKGPSDTVRGWVVGCATGEEVYTLAMLLVEHAATLENPPKLQLFATDIDEKGYATGRAGLYPAAALTQVDPERIKRFFTKDPGGYRVSQELREMVLFALHNVLHDPPFARLDLVSCRNLFIYLDAEAQAQVLETFHCALNENGILFLGSSESAGDGELFEPAVSSDRRIFRRRTTSRRILLPMDTTNPPATVRRSLIPARPRPQAVNGEGADGETVEGEALEGEAAHVRLLEQQEHPGIVVDAEGNVVHLSEGAGRFLRIQDGEPTWRLRDLAPEDAWALLRSALHHAFADGEATDRPLQMTLDGVERSVRVHIRPAEGKAEGLGFALVLFEERADANTRPPSATRVAPDGASGATDADVEAELERANDALASTRAAHDRAVAELRRANEDLRSINEEQNAVGEELATGREELQAVNEELASTNQELQSTIEEMHRTNADLKNLIESTEIGTIFLDRELKIRRFTPPVTQVFNFVDRDLGRALGDITHRLRRPHLMEDVRRVLDSQEPVEWEAETETGAWFVVRINPYRSHDNEADGVVITLFDHTEYHRIQEALHEAKRMAEAANRAKGPSLSNLLDRLRRPLVSITEGMKSLKLENGLTPEQEEAIQRVGTGVEELVSMLEPLPDATPQDGGSEEVDAESPPAESPVAEASHPESTDAESGDTLPQAPRKSRDPPGRKGVT